MCLVLITAVFFFLNRISSVQFSHSVMSDTSWPHGPQHARPPWPSPTPGVYSNSSPLSCSCHPTISSSVISFSSCLQSFPVSGSMSWLFAAGRQSTGASASVSVLPMNIQGRFPLDWLVWSPCSPRDCKEPFPAAHFESINSSALSLLYGPALTSVHASGKTIAFTRWTFLFKMGKP